MDRGFLNVLVIDCIIENIDLFTSILNNIKVDVRFLIFQNWSEALEYFDEDDCVNPELIFINYDIFKDELLDEMMRRKYFCNMITTIYSEEIEEDEIEDFFVKNGNICIIKTESKSVFEKKISEVIMVSWQYHTSGLNKDLFIFKI